MRDASQVEHGQIKERRQRLVVTIAGRKAQVAQVDDDDIGRAFDLTDVRVSGKRTASD